MAGIKLGKLPDRTLVKMTFSVPPELKGDLEAYQAAYREAYGVDEPIADLITAMLRAYLDSDRSFSRRRNALSK